MNSEWFSVKMEIFAMSCRAAGCTSCSWFILVHLTTLTGCGRRESRQTDRMWGRRGAGLQEPVWGRARGRDLVRRLGQYPKATCRQNLNGQPDPGQAIFNLTQFFLEITAHGSCINGQHPTLRFLLEVKSQGWVWRGGLDNLAGWRCVKMCQQSYNRPPDRSRWGYV